MRKLLTDDELVTKTANSLQVGEEEVFCKAYEAYHHEKIHTNAKRICESLYLDFFKNERKLPFWVRDFCRKTLGGICADT